MSDAPEKAGALAVFPSPAPSYTTTPSCQRYPLRCPTLRPVPGGARPCPPRLSTHWGGPVAAAAGQLRAGTAMTTRAAARALREENSIGLRSKRDASPAAPADVPAKRQRKALGNITNKNGQAKVRCCPLPRCQRCSLCSAVPRQRVIRSPPRRHGVGRLPPGGESLPAAVPRQPRSRAPRTSWRWCPRSLT